MPAELPENVLQALNVFLREEPAGRRSGGASVKTFCGRHPEILKSFGLTDRQMAAWLLKLGLVSPKGIFLKNTGVDSILRFRPHAIWGTDGKQMLVSVNGESFRWVWQCLVDFKTTLIVGGLVAAQETTENLLEAIRRSHEKTGITPIAIVLDNRLSENLPAIRQYLDTWGIQILQTFPGNSKSNGITEGNFSVFERWCGGKVEIRGDSPQELSRSIAEVLVEVFTQLRNHVPRRSLGWKTSKETADQSSQITPAEKQTLQEQISALVERLRHEEAVPEVSAEKKAVLDQVEQEVRPSDPDTFRRALRPAIFTANLLLQALAIWKTRRQTNPEKHYGHAYFAGIARNLANEFALQSLTTHLDTTYTHHWNTRGRIRNDDLARSLAAVPEKTCLRLASDYLHMPVPAYANRVMLDLKDCFLIASGGIVEQATQLRQTIQHQLLSWTRQSYRHRERLIRSLFEWENFVRFYAQANAPA